MGCSTLVLTKPNMLPLFAPLGKVALQCQLDLSSVTAQCKVETWDEMKTTNPYLCEGRKTEKMYF